MWNYGGTSKINKRGMSVDGAPRTNNQVIVILPTKLSIKKIGKGTYRMQINRGGATLFEAKGSNAQLACILRDKRYLPRELGSKSGFTYIDVVEDPGKSGVVDLYRRHATPKGLGTPIPFKAEMALSEQPASLDDDVEQITGLTDDLEGEVGADTVAAKAKTATEMVYDVTLRYSGSFQKEVMRSIDVIASNLPGQGVTVTSKSEDGVGQKGYLRVKTQQGGEGVKSIIWGICSGKRLSDYETPAEIDLTIVEQPAPADKPLVTGAEAGTQPQQTYTVILEFAGASKVRERNTASGRITSALSASGLSVSEIYRGPTNRQLAVTGQIAQGALESLLNRVRVGETPYETPTISVLNL